MTRYYRLPIGKAQRAHFARLDSARITLLMNGLINKVQSEEIRRKIREQMEKQQQKVATYYRQAVKNLKNINKQEQQFTLV